jgi:predicted transcriptional regulator
MPEVIGADVLKKFMHPKHLRSQSELFSKARKYREIVYETILKAERPLNGFEIVERTKINYITARKILIELYAAGLIDRYDSGNAWYWFPKKQSPQETPKEEVKPSA